MKYSLIFSLLFFSNLLFSQDIFLGAKFGLNLSQVNSEVIQNLEQKTGFHAGITSEFSFTEFLSIQTELLYSTQGASNRYLDLSMNYLSIPVLVKVYPVENFSLDIGPQLSFLLSNKAVFYGINIETESYEDVDFGLAAGVTYKSRFDVYAQARFVYGVTEFDNSGKSKNQVFQFSLGYNFL